MDKNYSVSKVIEETSYYTFDSTQEILGYKEIGVASGLTYEEAVAMVDATKPDEHLCAVGVVDDDNGKLRNRVVYQRIWSPFGFNYKKEGWG